jgi:ABC-type phosphate/phosphonate transport system permease subunit
MSSDAPVVRDTDVEATHALRRVSGSPSAPRRIPRWWWLVAAALVVASWWFVLSRADGGPGAGQLAASLSRFLERLGGGDASTVPAFRQARAWREAGQLAVDTVVMSILAAATAGVAALATIGFASRRLTSGELSVLPAPLGWGLRTVVRGMHVVTRSIPEYLWALLVVLVLRPGIVTGALALALHNIGVMGRLGADLVDDLDDAPLGSLRAAGASTLQTVVYGVVPQLLPQLLTFVLYRWEVMMRASAVVGFVTAAGIGYELRLALSRFDYTWMTVLLVTYVGLTFGVDLISAGLRRLAR